MLLQLKVELKEHLLKELPLNKSHWRKEMLIFHLKPPIIINLAMLLSRSSS